MDECSRDEALYRNAPWPCGRRAYPPSVYRNIALKPRRIAFKLVDQIPDPRSTDLEAVEVVIVCPWLKGLPRESGLWISALPIHDVNSFISGNAHVDVPSELCDRLYFGVFALDRFRSSTQLLAALRTMGVKRIINLPSVSFFDGRSATILKSLDLGPAGEVEFLRQAKASGLDVALCTREPLARELKDASLFDFILLHEGPGRAITAMSPSG